MSTLRLRTGSHRKLWWLWVAAIASVIGIAYVGLGARWAPVMELQLTGGDIVGVSSDGTLRMRVIGLRPQLKAGSVLQVGVEISNLSGKDIYIDPVRAPALGAWVKHGPKFADSDIVYGVPQPQEISDLVRLRPGEAVSGNVALELRRNGGKSGLQLEVAGGYWTYYLDSTTGVLGIDYNSLPLAVDPVSDKEIWEGNVFTPIPFRVY